MKYITAFCKRPYVRINACHLCRPIPRRNRTHSYLQQINPLYSKLLIDNEVVLVWVLIESESQVESDLKFQKRKRKILDALICLGSTLHVAVNFS